MCHKISLIYYLSIIVEILSKYVKYQGTILQGNFNWDGSEKTTSADFWGFYYIMYIIPLYITSLLLIDKFLANKNIVCVDFLIFVESFTKCKNPPLSPTFADRQEIWFLF